MPAVLLDADQQAAVDHREGPCLVLAGPGSGKTRVIVERFVRICAEGVPPDQQLVLTYTRRAAAEMRERAERAHGALPDEAPLTNYHSFAIAVVRSWGWLLGISPAFHIADDAERWLHVEAVLAELRPPTLWNPLRPQDLIAPLLEVIKTAKQELVIPEHYAGWAQRRLATCDSAAERALLERHRECALVYAGLQERYRRHAMLDYEDAILIAETLVRTMPAAREAIAGTLRHVMVDEYQDTDYAQSRLVEALLAGHRNILVVADDDQSIYKFRGASRANLDRFEAAHPDRRLLVLSRNYRSSAPVVEVSRAIITGADPRSRIEKRLIAVRGGGAPAELWCADTEHDEMAAIAAECDRLIAAGTRADGIALLLRLHADMPPAAAALRSQGVPHQVQGGRGFFQQPEIKDVLAMLTAADDPGNSQAVLRCLHLPAWRVSGAGRLALVAACRRHGRPLAELAREGVIEELDGDDARATRRCVDAVTELHARAGRDDVREVLQAALESSDAVARLDRLPPVERLQAGANLSKLGEQLDTFADWSDDRRVSTALRYLDALRRSRDAAELAPVDPAAEGVMLLTAHAAKGLEWPIVFLPRCVESRWSGRTGPTAQLSLPVELVPEQVPEGDAAEDEERRLFYVAATRARDRLVLTRARRYPFSPGGREERPSPFVPADGDRLTLVTVPPGPRRSPPGPRRRPVAPIEGRPALSVAGLRDYRTCARRFQYGHVYHMPVAPSPQAWYGRLIHAVLQSAAIRRRTGAVIAGDEIAALWREACDATPGERAPYAELRALGEAQLRRYVATPAWCEAALAEVEQPFTLRLTTADVNGRFDRIDRPAGRAPVIVDYKTGPPREAEREAADLQVRAYASGLAQREGLEELTVELHRLQTAEVTRLRLGGRDLDRAFRHVSASAAEVAAALRTGDFPPRPSAWSCGHCDFRIVCDEGRGAALPG